jgi:predicted ATPase
MSDWSDEETDDPTYADRRNFYKVEQWSRDGQHVLDLVFVGSSQSMPHLRAHYQASAAYSANHPAADAGAVSNRLAAGVRQDILERTDGIPLFVEEMTKAVLEAVGQQAAEQSVAAIPSQSIYVPASLHASLMARLDRLGPAKEVAQIGAAIGREFSHALLVVVARKPEADTVSALDRLIAAGLLLREGMPPRASYWFKHVLVRDAAYSTLLRGKRKELHTNIANGLESDFPEIIENQPGVLAQHCAEAGLVEKADAPVRFGRFSPNRDTRWQMLCIPSTTT